MSNPNHPAHPTVDKDGDGNFRYYNGLTKREAFAMAAMQGIIANPESVGTFEAICREAISYADTMLAELAKEGEK